MMNRGGSMRPGMGGNTMAGNMLQGMYAPGPGTQLGGGGPGAQFGMGVHNNWGMGQQPQTPESVYRLQEQCAKGDGAACISLQSVMGRFGEQQNQWHNKMAQNQQMAAMRNRPMGAKAWG